VAVAADEEDNYMLACVGGTLLVDEGGAPEDLGTHVHHVPEDRIEAAMAEYS
jgi:hypothetical protein